MSALTRRTEHRPPGDGPTKGRGAGARTGAQAVLRARGVTVVAHRSAIALGCAALSLYGCPSQRGAVAQRTLRLAPLAAVPPDEPALVTLVARLRAGDVALLGEPTVRLEPAGERRELTGEPAQPEQVAEARVALRAGGAREVAGLVLRTTCGNAWILGLAWSEQRWRVRATLALVTGERPGSCARTEVRAEPLALSSDVPRELAVVWSTQDETGERAVGPVLSVLRLDGAGGLTELLHAAAFGGLDEQTGQVFDGEYTVIEDTPPPRDLFVTVRRHDDALPRGTRTHGTRRQYRLDGATLRLERTADERQE